MQAVILAAGRGKRMGDLTNEVPKPMLKIAGKNLLEWKLEALPDHVDEVVIVIGYLGNLIREYFGESHGGRKIKYVEQGDLRGTGPALLVARELLGQRFIVMMGDDLYAKEDFESVLAYPWAMLAEVVKVPKLGALIQLHDSGILANILERQALTAGDLNNAGLYVLGKEILDYPLASIGGGEFGLPQMIALAAKDFDIKIVPTEKWKQVTAPNDIDSLNTAPLT